MSPRIKPGDAKDANLYTLPKHLHGVCFYSLLLSCHGVHGKQHTLYSPMAVVTRLIPLQFAHAVLSPFFDTESRIEVAQSFGKVSESQILRNSLASEFSRLANRIGVSQVESHPHRVISCFIIWTGEIIWNSSGGSRPTSYCPTSPGDVAQMDWMEEWLSMSLESFRKSPTGAAVAT